MSVLIKGMEKPEHCGYCRFRYDGICHALQKTQYSMNECPLVVIDDAGLNDTISRQAATDALSNGALVNYQNAGHNNGLVKAIDVIKGLPSAQQWIPCSERLPIIENYIGARVLVTTSWGLVREAYYCVVHWKIDDIPYELTSVVAWMPLPEPYNQEDKQ